MSVSSFSGKRVKPKDFKYGVHLRAPRVRVITITEARRRLVAYLLEAGKLRNEQ